MIVVDSGFWLALANKRDAFHQQARTRFPEFQQEGFITTWCVITETLLPTTAAGWCRCPHCPTQQSFDRRTASIRPNSGSTRPRIINLMNQYRNLPMDLADASLVTLGRASRTWTHPFRRSARLQYLSLERHSALSEPADLTYDLCKNMADSKESAFQQDIIDVSSAQGWLVGNSAHYDATTALYTEDLLAYFQTAWPKQWEKTLQKQPHRPSRHPDQKRPSAT